MALYSYDASREIDHTPRTYSLIEHKLNQTYYYKMQK